MADTPVAALVTARSCTIYSAEGAIVQWHWSCRSCGLTGRSGEFSEREVVKAGRAHKCRPQRKPVCRVLRCRKRSVKVFKDGQEPWLWLCQHHLDLLAGAEGMRSDGDD